MNSCSLIFPLGIWSDFGDYWIFIRYLFCTSSSSCTFSACSCDYWYNHHYSHSCSSRYRNVGIFDLHTGTFIEQKKLLFLPRLGLFIIKKRASENEFSKLSTNRSSEKPIRAMSKSEAAWRRIHGIHGFLIIILGLVNICLGVFLAVLPLAVWIVWYVYFGILMLALLLAELLALLRRFTRFNQGPKKVKGKSSEKIEFPIDTAESSFDDCREKN